MKKIWFILGLLISFYLIIPGPKLPPPDLPQSLKSDEPGDTIQISRVSAYYTEKQRPEVFDFYTQYFSNSGFLNLPLPTYRLNHPPEFAKEVWVDTKQSYYLEEAVHPLRESLFINGFEWENDVFTPPERRIKNKINIAGKIWPAKVSLRWFPSKTVSRLLVFWPAWLLFWLVGKNWLQELKVFKRK